MMARNLFHLGTMTYNDEYLALANEMTSRMLKLIPDEPSYLSNWASLAMEIKSDFAEIAIIGPDALTYAREINALDLPFKVIAATIDESDLAIFDGKSTIGGQTTIFVCYNRTCKLPVTSVAEALAQLH